MHRIAGCGRLPVDAAQDKEAPVEPGLKQPLQIRIDDRNRGLGFAQTQHVVSQGDEFGGSAGGQVQSAEELAPRTYRRLMQRPERFGI